MTTLLPPTAPREGGKMRSIEAARAIAALVVLLMHSANLMRTEQFSGHTGLGGALDFGYIGVDFFFVLSGFIITYVHFSEIGHPNCIPRYLWRRFSRIYPIFWFVLLLVLTISVAGRYALGKGLVLDMAWEDIAGTVFLMMGQGEPKYVGVAWSLQYEVVFYVAFCLLLANARIGMATFVIWGAFVALQAIGATDVHLPMNLGNAHCLQFLFGVVVGATARRYSLRVSVAMLPLALLALAAAVVFEVYGPLGRHAASGRIALGLTSAFLLTALVALEREQVLRTPIWLARVGSVSYSIYLGHIVFINLTYSVLLKLGIYHSLPELLVFATAVCVALGATITIGHYVEMPLVHLLKDFLTSRPKNIRAPAVSH